MARWCDPWARPTNALSVDSTNRGLKDPAVPQISRRGRLRRVVQLGLVPRDVWSRAHGGWVGLPEYVALVVASSLPAHDRFVIVLQTVVGANACRAGQTLSAPKSVFDIDRIAQHRRIPIGFRLRPLTVLTQCCHRRCRPATGRRAVHRLAPRQCSASRSTDIAARWPSPPRGDTRCGNASSIAQGCPPGTPSPWMHPEGC